MSRRMDLLTRMLKYTEQAKSADAKIARLFGALGFNNNWNIVLCPKINTWAISH